MATDPRETAPNDPIEWFEDNASRFKHATAVEELFIELSPDQQDRLNRFKLWAIEQDRAVAIAGKNVLEFGAGHGRLAIEMPSLANYVGVDASAELVRIGQERLVRAGLADRARLIASDCRAYDGPTNAFDVVCSLGMFPYVDDPGGIVRKMAQHLKPGGSLFIDFHHSSPIYDFIRRSRARRRRQTGGVTPVYTREAIRRWFREAGLVETRFVMREYPLLGGWYARHGWRPALALRNWLAARPWLDALATDGFAFGTKPTAV